MPGSLCSCRLGRSGTCSSPLSHRISLIGLLAIGLAAVAVVVYVVLCGW